MIYHPQRTGIFQRFIPSCTSLMILLQKVLPETITPSQMKVSMETSGGTS